jgi:hypothetical protein
LAEAFVIVQRLELSLDHGGHHMNSDHAYIHQEWHRAASTRDTPALIALYADNAILESPLVPVIMDGKHDGVLRGKA